VLVALAAAVLAAGVAANRLAGGSAHAVAWRDLSPRLRGIELPVPARRIFKVPRAIHDFQAEMMPGLHPRKVPLDWSSDELVLVSPGPRSSTGYGVRVERVEEWRNRVDVFVRETSPTRATRVQARVTFPYRLIAIPRSGKRVSIVWEGQ
jgi:hypothetical protein